MRSLKIGTHRSEPPGFYKTPKEVWGFRVPRAVGTPVAVARRFIGDNADLFGLHGVRGTLRDPRVIHSLGATHVIFRQLHAGRRIHRAYVTVHIGAGARVYLSKNRAVPAEYLPTTIRFPLSRSRAIRTARRALRGRDGVRVMGKVEQVWFPRRTRLRPALKVRLHTERPREEWIFYLDAERGTVLSRVDNLAARKGWASVFDPNPVVALGKWRELKTPDGRPRRPPLEAYRLVELEGLGDDRTLDGARVHTRPTARRVRRTDRRFVFASHEPGFEEAMAYAHIDAAIRYLESLGYRGGRRIFRAPIAVNARGTRDDDSWYSPGERTLTFGTGDVDDAEDGEIILHELGHAVQDAICPDFGQSPEAMAIGEGFGDYFAASFFAARKPPALRDGVMSWDALAESDASPPFLRTMTDRRTYRAFDPKGDEHDNGSLWAATLWDIWRIVGRDAADRIIVESHFQLDGFTTFARAARAILDADRNVYRGAHGWRLARVFRARRIGPL
jgi:hypothetical protein